MRRSFTPLIPLLLFISCGEKNEDGFYRRDKAETFRFMADRYGIWKENSEGITLSEGAYTEYPRLEKETDTVPAHEGITFGIQYRLHSDNGSNGINLSIVWKLPGKIYDKDYGDSVDMHEAVVVSSLNQKAYIQHTLGRAEVALKGRWQLLVYYRKRLLYRKSFFLQ